MMKIALWEVAIMSFYDFGFKCDFSMLDLLKEMWIYIFYIRLLLEMDKIILIVLK